MLPLQLLKLCVSRLLQLLQLSGVVQACLVVSV
jgi:hypothetical protein